MRKRNKKRFLSGLTSLLLSAGISLFPTQANSQEEYQNEAAKFMRDIGKFDKYLNAFGFGTGMDWENTAKIVEESDKELDEVQEKINNGEPFTYLGVEFNPSDYQKHIITPENNLEQSHQEKDQINKEQPINETPNQNSKKEKRNQSSQKEIQNLSELEQSLLGKWTSQNKETIFNLNPTNLILDLGEDYAKQNFPNGTYELKQIPQGILLTLPDRTPGQKEVLLKIKESGDLLIDKPSAFKSYSNKEKIEFSPGSIILTNSEKDRKNKELSDYLIEENCLAECLPFKNSLKYLTKEQKKRTLEGTWKLTSGKFFYPGMLISYVLPPMVEFKKGEDEKIRRRYFMTTLKELKKVKNNEIKLGQTRWKLKKEKIEFEDYTGPEVRSSPLFSRGLEFFNLNTLILPMSSTEFSKTKWGLETFTTKQDQFAVYQRMSFSNIISKIESENESNDFYRLINLKKIIDKYPSIK
ncbi:MAG: hypothetical protein ACOCUU_01465 [Nanoarchaeota archaeon]